jgi:S1-C subfamily serine protease
MFAIAPRTAVTATHCLAGLDPQRLQLLFGYARMEWERHTIPRSARDLGNDVAVLCLREDAPDVLEVAPGEVARGDLVRVIGYGQPRAHMQSADACRVLAILSDEFYLDCPQSRGASGGPVVNDEGEVVAVMSRTGQARSVASALPPRAARLCR